MPSGWILRRGLKKFDWRNGGEGANHLAALMAYAAFLHTADEETGVTRLTYDDICERTGLSRPKLSSGLQILKVNAVIESVPDALQSTYRLSAFDPAEGWAKFPGKCLYSGGRIVAFDEFRLRKRVELEALKLFYLFIAQRDRATNTANLSYDKIEEYTGINRTRIKSALSFLASLSLIYTERAPSSVNEYGISNSYRIVGIDTSNHSGTRGRSLSIGNQMSNLYPSPPTSPRPPSDQ